MAWAHAVSRTFHLIWQTSTAIVAVRQSHGSLAVSPSPYRPKPDPAFPFALHLHARPTTAVPWATQDRTRAGDEAHEIRDRHGRAGEGQGPGPAHHPGDQRARRHIRRRRRRFLWPDHTGDDQLAVGVGTRPPPPPLHRHRGNPSFLTRGICQNSLWKMMQFRNAILDLSRIDFSYCTKDDSTFSLDDYCTPCVQAFSRVIRSWTWKKFMTGWYCCCTLYLRTASSFLHAIGLTWVWERPREASYSYRTRNVVRKAKSFRDCLQRELFFNILISPCSAVSSCSR